MILTRLSEYWAALGQSEPPGYQILPIRWFINLDKSGKVTGPLTPTTGTGKPNDTGKKFLAPSIARQSQKSRPNLLADRMDYVLGRGEPEDDEDRTRLRHCDFTRLIQECADETREPDVRAVALFLESPQPGEMKLPDDLDPSHRISFMVNGIVPFDLPSVRAFWADRTAARRAERSGSETTCIACGRMRPPARSHDVKVKGIPGGQSSGNALVSANKQAFCSYGLTQSTVSPVCQECASAYAKGLNSLLADDRHVLRLKDSVYVFWTRHASDFDCARLLSNPEPEDVGALLRSALTGAGSPRIGEADFYALGLSASGSRVVVRSWLETTVPDARRHIAEFFEGQRISAPDGSDGRPLGIFALAASLTADAKKKLPPPITRSLLATALEGTPLPLSLLSLAVARVRAGDKLIQGGRSVDRLTQPRAAIIKLVLTSNKGLIPGKENSVMPELDKSSTDPAYLCGRLFAELEAVQKAAVKPKATIVDKYFGSASSTPASVFGVLMRGAQAHLAKLRKENEGAYRAIDSRLQDICAALDGFPRTLTLAEQGLFCLGYYHQRATDRAAMLDAVARRNSEHEPVAAQE